MTIRVATDADWPAIWPFFEEIVRAGETYAYPEDLDSDGARSLWMEPPPGRTFVLEEDGRVLGSAKVGPNRPGRGAHIATASFMVSPEAQGRGVGRRLGEYAVQWARRAGYAGMQFDLLQHELACSGGAASPPSRAKPGLWSLRGVLRQARTCPRPSEAEVMAVATAGAAEGPDGTRCHRLVRHHVTLVVAQGLPAA